MAQSEDTELRDLVIEALEKNGSLAKIRALLRAKIFLAFDDDYDSIKENVSLDNVLKMPEGVLCLSIIHEFLEFCNLKNTLFVYKSESRQGKEYKYEGQKKLYEKLNLKHDAVKEPVLVTILKYVLKSHQRLFMDRSNAQHALKNDNNSNYREDQNCTYIVHDDSSSTTSQTQSDNSSDEKTKLHLRLQLDNSDTDTSSDSARDKSCSEYIPNEHVIQNDNNLLKLTDNVLVENIKNFTLHGNKEKPAPYFLNDLKIVHNSSSDSTSYVELKPFNSSEEKLLNTTGIPTALDNIPNNDTNQNSIDNVDGSHSKSYEEAKVSIQIPNNVISLSPNNNSAKEGLSKLKSLEQSAKSESQETTEYSYDFTMSGTSKNKDNQSPKSVQEEIHDQSKVSPNESPHENSQSSRSSISISDVADLISEKSLSVGPNIDDGNNKSKVISRNLSKSPRSLISPSNDSGDFSESPVPSLSNLSLDIHSD